MKEVEIILELTDRIRKLEAENGIRYEMPDLSLFKERREKLRFSMQYVMNATGISKATISRLERGFNPEYYTVKKLHEFYSKNELL